MSHFKIIVPFYNVEKWIEKCIKSIKLQSYSDYECILVDDMSTDNSADIARQLIGDDNKFKLIINKQKKYALENIYNSINESKSNPEDIIITVDGDDFLSKKNVLNKLSKIYNEYGCLMTYGSYMEYPSMKKGPFCQQIPDNIIKSNSYRESTWLSSHLRTFKRSLWDSIDVSDLKDEEGRFYRMTWDMAFMFPMLEMAGPHAIHIPEILYIYNRENPINDDKVDHGLQLETEFKIRNKEKYSQHFVSCDIMGPGYKNSGLGNQLFCIANALSYAKDNNKRTFFPQMLANKHISKYKEIFYTNLSVGMDVDICDNSYSEADFSFSKIPKFNGNVFMKGYFQSEKYFLHNRAYILDCLRISKLQKLVIDKYGDYSDYTSIHVRRGDYLELEDYHGVLKVKYYKDSISHFKKNKKYIIFSDDIKWCKNNLNFIENVVYSSCEKDWEDMILMSTCESHIIANSSFSWWSAWISGNKTIAPEKWFNANLSAEDLIPNRWTRV